MAKNLGYEPENINTKPILVGGLILGVIFAISLGICVVLFDLLEVHVSKSDEALSPLISERILPPEPRLQTNPNEDIALLRHREDLYIARYQWIDRSAGVARIPVERAIEIIASTGLPARPTKPSTLQDSGEDSVNKAEADSSSSLEEAAE